MDRLRKIIREELQSLQTESRRDWTELERLRNDCGVYHRQASEYFDQLERIRSILGRDDVSCEQLVRIIRAEAWK